MKPPRSVEARSLATPLFRQRRIPSKKIYSRKKPALKRAFLLASSSHRGGRRAALSG